VTREAIDPIGEGRKDRKEGRKRNGVWEDFWRGMNLVKAGRYVSSGLVHTLL